MRKGLSFETMKTCLLILFLINFFNVYALKWTARRSPCSLQSVFAIYAIVEIKSNEDFEYYVSKPVEGKEKYAVVDFQKSKCRPCIKVAPLFIALSETYSENSNFYKVDSDSWPQALSLMRDNGVRSVPTFQIWKDGAKLHSVQGTNLEEIEKFLKENK